MAADITLNTGGDAVTILMNDHQQIKSLFDELLNGDGTSRPATIERLKPLLVLHNATEENLVYPAIHTLVGRPHHAKGLYHQQDDAAIAFFDLALRAPGDSEFLRQAADLRDALLAHVREEEESEFVHLREELAPEAMAKLSADVREFRGTFAPR